MNKRGRTNLKRLLDKILFSLEAVLGSLQLILQALVAQVYLMVKVVLKLVDDGYMFAGQLIRIRTLQHVVDGPLSELLQGRLQGQSHGLIVGLQVPLSLIGSLYTRVGEVLDSSSARDASTTRGSGGL